jgi:hypothetical protein
MLKSSSDSRVVVMSGNGERVQPKPGDGFSVRLSDETCLAGCVVKDNAVVGPFRNVLLVYVFKPNFHPVVDAFGLVLDKVLLLPPLLTNLSPWQDGVFQVVDQRMLDGVKIPHRHVFMNRLNKRYFDEFGEPVEQGASCVGDFSLKLGPGIKKEIEMVINDLRAP